MVNQFSRSLPPLSDLANIGGRSIAEHFTVSGGRVENPSDSLSLAFYARVRLCGSDSPYNRLSTIEEWDV